MSAPVGHKQSIYASSAVLPVGSNSTKNTTCLRVEVMSRLLVLRPSNLRRISPQPAWMCLCRNGLSGAARLRGQKSMMSRHMQCELSCCNVTRGGGRARFAAPLFSAFRSWNLSLLWKLVCILFIWPSFRGALLGLICTYRSTAQVIQLWQGERNGNATNGWGLKTF